MSAVTATPTLTVAGQAVPLAPSSTPGLVAIGSLSVKWGRATVLDRPTPATASITLLDQTAGYTFASRTDLTGQLVVIGWTASDGSSGTTFRGRITDVDAQPSSSAGFSVTLAASSKEIDAANYTVPDNTVWPAESFSARLARIMGVMPAGLFAGGATMPTRGDVGFTNVADPSKDFGDYIAGQQDVSGQDVLSLLHQLWDSTYPVPLVYDPATDGFTFSTRRNYEYLPIGTALSAGLVIGNNGLYQAQAVSGLGMLAGQLAYSGTLSQPIDSRLTVIEVSYLDQTNNYTSTTIAAGTSDYANEATIGRRSLSIDSIHADAGMAAQLASLWATIADGEGRLPRLATITFATADATPLPSAAHAACLLSGRETSQRIFLGGSWITDLGVRPLVGIVGGTISYAAGQWSIQAQPAPGIVDWSTTPLPVQYAASSTAVTLADIDPSVTLGDLAFIDVGAGYTANNQPPWGST